MRWKVYQDWHKKRLDVIPGITGLWQVQGRSRVSFDEMVRMDLDYAAQSSLWLDLKDNSSHYPGGSHRQRRKIKAGKQEV